MNQVCATQGWGAKKNDVAAAAEAQKLGFEIVRPCAVCLAADMVLKRLQSGAYVVSCLGYPQCRHSRFFDNVTAMRVSGDQECRRCGPEGSVKKLEFTFARGAAPGFPPVFVGCYSCDAALADVVISERCVRWWIVR